MSNEESNTEVFVPEMTEETCRAILARHVELFIKPDWTRADREEHYNLGWELHAYVQGIPYVVHNLPSDEEILAQCLIADEILRELVAEEAEEAKL